MKGKVYLIGAGPGAPDLITLRGAELLAQAETLVYDYLAHPDLLRRAPGDCEMIYVGKQAGCHAMAQDDINALLVEKAGQGRRVARLKGGDPFVFGRGGEECEALRQAGIPFEVVPGVTSGVAAPMYAGIPVTHRGLATSVTFVTGHERADAPDDGLPYGALARLGGTLVFYMSVGNLERIASRLMEEGLSPQTPAAAVRWGGHPQQQTLTADLGDLAAMVSRVGLRPPAIIVIGEVVRMRETLSWFEQRPLFGRRILVTRSRTQASDLLVRLGELGAEGQEFSTIAIAPTDDPEALEMAAAQGGAYDWIVFNSVNAVEHFLAALARTGRDVRALGAAHIAAIGPATARALNQAGLVVDVTPERYVAEELLAALRAYGDLTGRRVLVPRSNLGRQILVEGLAEAGAAVHEVNAYRALPNRPDHLEETLADLDAGRIQAVTFTSSSTAQGFHDLVGAERFAALPGRCCLASIGPITSRTIRALGAEPTIEAEHFTLDGLVERLVQYFAATGDQEG